MRTLVLASSSPYRKALLMRLGVSFDALSPDVDETPRAGEPADDLVRRLALLKARAIGAKYPNALIIGSDQCALCGETILGKPGNFEAARQQLKAAAGGVVTFHTGLCLLDSLTGETQIDVVTVTVHFRTLSDRQIAAYLRREAPYHCAGSFKSEGLGVALVERMECDDPTALIGLPLIRLVAMLAHAGVEVLAG